MHILQEAEVHDLVSAPCVVKLHWRLDLIGLDAPHVEWGLHTVHTQNGVCALYIHTEWGLHIVHTYRMGSAHSTYTQNGVCT